MSVPTNVGREVWYEGVRYKIERDYGNGVYYIGNGDAWVDLVTESMIVYVR